MRAAECNDFKLAVGRNLSHDEMQHAKALFRKHRDEVRASRKLYMQDVARSVSDPTFQSIVFDGADSATTICPLRWVARNGEVGGDDVVQQSFQNVLIHGTVMNIYPIMPYMSKGADMAVSTLLHSLQFVDKSVTTLRLQCDGVCAVCVCCVCFLLVCV